MRPRHPGACRCERQCQAEIRTHEINGRIYVARPDGLCRMDDRSTAPPPGTTLRAFESLDDSLRALGIAVIAEAKIATGRIVAVARGRGGGR